MNSLIVSILALLVLFYILAKSADLAINNLRIIGQKLGIGVFFLGLVMGFFTSFPEMAIGINTIVNNVQNISLGNLFGGVMVLFGLVLGINIFLQKKIKAEQSLWQFGSILLFLIIPIILGLNGTLGLIEGLVIILGYFILLFIMYRNQKHTIEIPHLIDKKGLIKNIFLFLLGVVLVLVVANFTVEITSTILSELPLSKFVIGIIIFAIGTNFPEIIVSIRSWKNNIKELSFSNLLGSGMANMLLIGIFSIMKPFHLTIDASYYILLFGIIFLLILVFIFYKTNNSLKRKEGIFLIVVYLVFIALQIIFEKPVIN